MSKKKNEIYCNCCGKLICEEKQQETTSYLAIKKQWGYFSNEKDGQVHSMDICETCYDKMIEAFAIAPETEHVTEYV